MKTKILFVHGMFQNSKSWDRWVPFFEQRGFSCSTPDWPFHEGEPAELREKIPAGLGRLTLADVVAKFAAEAATSDEAPIVIGHSVGGLVAQILASRGLAAAAVCISSVAPNDLIAVDWHLMKNVASITNPLKGHDPFLMSPEGFHENFCNTLGEVQARQAYEATATHDSRQVLRDCLGKTGHIDLSTPHVPLLFISGDHDHIIPAALNRRNCEHYKDSASIAEQVEFPSRDHFICNTPDWEGVATYAHNWLVGHVAERATSTV